MLRIGIVSYLNTAPLLWGLKKESLPDWIFVEDHPTSLNRALAEGKLDLALISSLEYAFHFENYFLIPDISISATGRVGSVLLFGPEKIEDLSGKKIVVTTASATSVALLKILLEDFCGLETSYSPGKLKDGLKTGAYLAIGDEALRLRPQKLFPEAYDLASLWMEHTRLPFVFAVFALRKDSWHIKRKEIVCFLKALYLSRAKGMASLEAIAQKCQGIAGLSSQECLLYLKGIEYDLSGLKQEALKVFFQHLLRRQEIPKFPRLDFLNW